MILRKASTTALRTALLLSATLLGAGSSLHAAPQTTKQEPPARYVLTVDGKTVTINLNEETQVELGATGQSRVRLTQIPTRIFDKAGVRFSYPVGFSFEADDTDRNVTIWTMSGANSMVMLQKFRKLSDAQILNAVVPDIVRQYPAKSTRVTPTSIVLGGKTLAGKKLNISIGTAKLVQEVFVFSNAKSSFTLILQDDLSASGKWTTEGTSLRKLVSSSLVIQ
jgi:hypothetical protein